MEGGIAIVGETEASSDGEQTRRGISTRRLVSPVEWQELRWEVLSDDMRFLVEGSSKQEITAGKARHWPSGRALEAPLLSGRLPSSRSGLTALDFTGTLLENGSNNRHFSP